MNAIDLPRVFLAELLPSLERQVLACALTEAERAGANPLVRGLSAESLTALCMLHLPGAKVATGREENSSIDEFDELFALLLDYVEPRDETGVWIAAALASAAQRDQHLWQDLGLPSRQELSAILELRFPRLAALNRENMKWKKFFYRQLCERADVPICKSPNCLDCSDRCVCFGPES